MSDRTRVLVVHPSQGVSRALAEMLGELRPSWVVAAIVPEQLEAALALSPPPVVVCSEPTTAIQRRARAWAILLLERDVALVGTGDTWATVAPLDYEVVADALDDLLARPPVAPTAFPDLPDPAMW